MIQGTNEQLCFHAIMLLSHLVMLAGHDVVRAKYQKWNSDCIFALQQQSLPIWAAGSTLSASLFCASARWPDVKRDAATANTKLVTLLIENVKKDQAKMVHIAFFSFSFFATNYYFLMFLLFFSLLLQGYLLQFIKITSKADSVVIRPVTQKLLDFLFSRVYIPSAFTKVYPFKRTLKSLF